MAALHNEDKDYVANRDREDGTTTSISDEIMLESFENPQHVWQLSNDPSIGGHSVGTFHIDKKKAVGVLDGQIQWMMMPTSNMHQQQQQQRVEKFAGFVRAATLVADGDDIGTPDFPDVSSCTSLTYNIRTTTPEYSGFRLGFGVTQPTTTSDDKNSPLSPTTTTTPNHQQQSSSSLPVSGYRYTLNSSTLQAIATNTAVRNGEDSFAAVVIPLTDFSSDWDAVTGDTLTSCYDNESVCPTLSTLRNLQTLSVWAQGVHGFAHLEIHSILASGCGLTSSNNNNNNIHAVTTTATTTAKDSTTATTNTTTILVPNRAGLSSSLVMITVGGLFLMILLMTIVVLMYSVPSPVNYEPVLRENPLHPNNGQFQDDENDDDDDDDDESNSEGKDDEGLEMT